MNFEKYANSMVRKKFSAKMRNKVEEVILKVFPDIALYKPEAIKVKPRPIKK